MLQLDFAIMAMVKRQFLSSKYTLFSPKGQRKTGMSALQIQRFSEDAQAEQQQWCVSGN
jgi:hypothetical protein